MKLTHFSNLNPTMVTGGEELETIENSPKNDKFDGFKLRILKI